MNWKHSQPLNSEQQQEEDRLLELMRQTRPAEPDEAAWNRAFAQIEQRLQAPVVPLQQHRPARWSRWAAVGAAAAVLAAIWLSRNIMNGPPSNSEEPFPVAEASEIEILSVQGADTQTLVVGNPPVEGALELLEPGEVTLFSVEAAPDDMVPEIRFHGPHSPMIWAHLDNENE